LPATIATGASFPLLAAIACGDLSHLGARIGWLYAANTAGGIAGALLGGVLLLPWLGLQGSLYACTALNVGLGLAAWSRTGVSQRRGAAAALALAAAGVGAVAWLLPATYMATVATRNMAGSLLFFREDTHGTVVVMREPFLDRAFNRLLVDGVSNSGDGMPSQRYMRLQTHLPVLLHAGPVERVLVICFGTGITYDAVFRHPDIKIRRCVELSPAVLAAAPLFSAANHHVEARPDADIRTADGRAFLLSDSEPYDVITLEPPPPNARGVVNLYSQEFYELCRQHLRPGGVMAQWVPLHTLNLESTRMLMRTFQNVFPHATLWTTEWQETMLLGTLDPLNVDVAAVEQQMSHPDLQRSLAEVGIPSVAQLFATFLMDEEALRAFTAGADVVTDDRPRIEYGRMPFADDFPRLLQALVDGRAELPRLPGLSAASPGLLEETYRQRAALLDFYVAAMAAWSGDRSAAAEALGRVVAVDPDNPYYRWFFIW
jgi:spermidine synthase